MPNIYWFQLLTLVILGFWSICQTEQEIYASVFPEFEKPKGESRKSLYHTDINMLDAALCNANSFIITCSTM